MIDKLDEAETFRAARIGRLSSVADSLALLQAWRSILPEQVFITAGPLLDNATPLTAHERASVGPLDAQRLLELESGRAYAKRALAMIGYHGVELPVAADRSPSWPTGALGSLTHVMGRDGGHFAAAVARNDTIGAVGIDVEREDGLHPRLWDHVLTRQELARILALPVAARATETQIIWCAKEAAGKAARRPIEPTELEVERDRDGDGYTATWRHSLEERDRSANMWHGQVIRSHGFILAAVVVPKGRST